MKVDEVLVNEVQVLVDEVARTHRYSMSRIYGLYNKVFDKNETPQSCASCLIRKVRELTAWLDGVSLPLAPKKTSLPRKGKKKRAG
mgnify:CR=1 FL=1